jgi:DNA-binding transcriptional LysR family regulator
MPELAALEVLLTVARTGSLKATAAEFGITQQAISARISALEAQTGVTLVVRGPRGSALTPSGAVVAEWAERLIKAAAEVDAGIAALRVDARRNLRISSSLTIAEQLLPGWIVSMEAAARTHGTAAPSIVLTATNSDAVIEQVRAGEADLGFVEGPSVPRSLRSRILAYDTLTLVVTADHPLARRSRPIEARELAATALASREPGSGTREALRIALLKAMGTDVVVATPRIELSTAAGVRQAVLAGAGSAVMGDLAVRDDVAAGRLREVPVQGVNLRRALKAVWIGERVPPAGPARDLLAHVVRVGRRPRG